MDALLLLPELYFKPRTIEELVNYLKDIAEHVPEMPVFYYHIPMLTGLTCTCDYKHSCSWRVF